VLFRSAIVSGEFRPGDRIVADTALKHVRLQGEGRPVVLRIVQTRGKALF